MPDQSPAPEAVVRTNRGIYGHFTVSRQALPVGVAAAVVGSAPTGHQEKTR